MVGSSMLEVCGYSCGGSSGVCFAETSQVSDDFAKQARAMAETRLDARKALLKRFAYLLVNWYVYSFTTLSILRDNLYKNGPLYIYTSAKVRNDPFATTPASLESLFVPVSREHHCTGMHLTTMPFLVDVFYMLRISNMKDCGTGLRHRVRVAQQGNQESTSLSTTDPEA